ncbi:MAG: hypothetical protein KKC79_17700 [Gammaproteobacteria bacterium]|nr:hypothetical protein [Gammaproteobacteria bacterium]MBU1444546.1 hypothetical protein [Gammaproteobacteria bacterium]MBU2286387.1 hypothetical protein [Gammaproteobacteria bacterium]MBU2410471.1 hypothetical protein [Gammaproteobacteria bacterium]
MNTKSSPNGKTSVGTTQSGHEEATNADDDTAAPRLPHEHDQSTDSQGSQQAQQQRMGQQAKKDVDSGMVDTDRGPVTDKVYNDKVKP